jgi:hypothetical protein
MSNLHCWKDHGEYLEETYGYDSDEYRITWSPNWHSGTCMLPDGHEGPHDFTDDREIGITFAAVD